MNALRIALTGSLLFFASFQIFAQTSSTTAPAVPRQRMAAFPQEDVMLHSQSLVFLKKGFPIKVGGEAWMGKPMRTLLVSSAAQYRHLPAVLVAAFSAKSKQDIDSAFGWLESYECENYLACTDYEQFLSKQIAAYGKSLSGVYKLRADRLLTNVQARAKSFPSPSQKEGFCPLKKEDQENWLKLSYQLYCAPYDIVNNSRGCAMLTSKSQPCSATEGLLNSLMRWTWQDKTAGSRMTNFEHTLQKNCDQQWNVKMDCDVQGVVKKLEFSCESLVQKYPAQVVCKSKQP